jgi:hypothetical protein
MKKQVAAFKKYLLPLASVLLLIIGYQLAFKATLSAWQVNRQLKDQVGRLSRLDLQSGFLERKETNLQSIIARYKIDTLTSRNAVINKIALIAETENVKLTEVPMQDPFYHTETFVLQRLIFEGDYFSLLRALNKLQAASDMGIIRTVSLKAAPHSQTVKLNSLPQLEIYLESIK